MKRPYVRFSLKALMAAVALLAIALGGYGSWHRSFCALVYESGYIPHEMSNHKGFVERAVQLAGNRVYIYVNYEGHDPITPWSGLGRSTYLEEPVAAELSRIYKAFKSPRGNYVVWRKIDYASGGFSKQWAVWSPETWARITAERPSLLTPDIGRGKRWK